MSTVGTMSSAPPQRRTLYFNDARHYYLFVAEPPISMTDAWRPVDEVAGTAVDTFVYGVSRDDGLFYPSQVGMQFKYGEGGKDVEGFGQAAYWRLWHNMQSLSERGIDPLGCLVARAHENSMDFFASLRLGGHGTMADAHRIESYGDRLAMPGRGFVNPEVRAHQLAVLRELLCDYETDGVELDFAAAPAGSAALLRPEDVAAHTATIVGWVAEVAAVARGRGGARGPGLVGAKVYPTEAMNLAMGIDVRAMLAAGSLDFAIPMVYGHNLVDPAVPFEWLLGAGAAVYPMLQPDYHVEEGRRFHTREPAAPAMHRAAAASYLARGAAGVCTWNARWPLGDAERGLLTELGDSAALAAGDKHYIVSRGSGATAPNLGRGFPGYVTPLPLAIAAADNALHTLPLHVVDSEAALATADVTLRLVVGELVVADELEISLNGAPLPRAARAVMFHPGTGGVYSGPYNWLQIEWKLHGDLLPRCGANVVGVRLAGRPQDLLSELVVEDVELLVAYGAPSARL